MTKMKTVIFVRLSCFLAVNAFGTHSFEYHKKLSVQPKATVDAKRDTEWWKNGVFYQIYPRSFKDSFNQGNGTLQGIISKLPYLKEIGITSTWISPFYPSPQVDQGYDISDYRDVDPMFGTLADLRSLIDKAHKLGMKIILDYVPNHTSHLHKWFQASLKNDTKYGDYYIWRNAKIVNGTRQPPNNWLSCFGGSAWEWNEERQQYYFHQFSWGQPDLNYRNPDVVEEMKDVLRYWLDFGADGFRMDAVPTLFEDLQLRDEPLSGIPVDPDDHDYLNHTQTLDLDETLDMVYQWRDVLDEFNRKNGTYDRIMMTEVYSDLNKTFYYYGHGNRLGAHFSFNFLSFVKGGVTKGFTSYDVLAAVRQWIEAIPLGYTSNWVLGNHDNNRVATRLGTQYVDALNMLISILPGVQVTYMGEEIGMEDGEVACTQGWDPQAIKNCSTFAEKSRDFERTPFQWDNSSNAGFNSGAQTWLPVSQKYHHTNLAAQNVSGLISHLNIYKDLLKVKADLGTAFDEDSISIQAVRQSDVLIVTRTIDSVRSYVLIWNILNESATIPLEYGDHQVLTVVTGNVYSNFTKNEKLKQNNNITLGAYEAVVFKVNF